MSHWQYNTVKGSKNKVYGSIQPDMGDLYKDIQDVKKICDKMLKSFKWDKQWDAVVDAVILTRKPLPLVMLCLNAVF